MVDVETRDPKHIYEDDDDFELVHALSTGLPFAVGLSGVYTQDVDPDSFHRRDTRTEDVVTERERLMNEIFWREVTYQFPKEGSEDTMPHGQDDFEFKDYRPEIFAQIREWCGVRNQDYLQSLTDPLRRFSTNSQSGEAFFLTSDRKYFIKTMSHSEHKLLREMLPEYFKYLSAQRMTFLTKFLGLHRVAIRGQQWHIMVQRFIFETDKDIHRVYDLKGSKRNRFAREGESTLKDLDWVKFEESICLHRSQLAIFRKQIKNDIGWLQQQKIMDYSLLVGIHNLSEDEEIVDRLGLKDVYGEFVNPFLKDSGGITSAKGDCIYFMGIIDLLQSYNKRKRVEHGIYWFNPFINSSEASCVPPVVYGGRMFSSIKAWSSAWDSTDQM